VIKVRVSKLAQILPTSTLDHIFDDSEEKYSLAGPYIAKNTKFTIFARDMQL
jgi:hypothetical protein